jgi:hypothetical protein
MLLLTNKDFREFVELLNSNGVRFLIVGGHAVALHGYPRFTAVTSAQTCGAQTRRALRRSALCRWFRPKG